MTDTIRRLNDSDISSALGLPPVLRVGLFSDLGALNIPVGTDLIRSSGYSVKGIGVADYHEITDTGQAETSWRKRSLNGRLFQIIGDSAGFVSFEALGGVGDYDPDADAGADNVTAFAAATAMASLGIKVQFARHAKYLTTVGIEIDDGNGNAIGFYGDSSYSPEIYVRPPATGEICFKNAASSTVVKNLMIDGITIWRIGAHAEHGILIDNLDGVYIDVRVKAVPGALGGAIGVSPFQPIYRPSKNVTVVADLLTYAGNFGVQYGNIDGCSMMIRRTQYCHREVVGLEPYCLGYRDFASSDVSGTTISWPSHGMATGDALIYSMQTNTAITGWNRANYYFAIVVDADHIKVADTKIDAIAGNTLAIAGLTGTHRLYRCGQLLNCKVYGSIIRTEDTPITATDSRTGTILAVAASGGYHENVDISGISFYENNPTSGSYGIGIFGAQNITIDGAQIVGVQYAAVFCEVAYMTSGVRDVNGNSIAPAIGLQLYPSGIVQNVVCRDFHQHGVLVKGGQFIIRNCDARSNVANTVGITLSLQAEASGSFANDNTAYVPNGAPYNLNQGRNNSVVGDDTAPRRDYRSKWRNRGTIFKTLTQSGSSITLGVVRAQAFSTTTYMGQLDIVARQNIFPNSNAAQTVCKINKSFSADTVHITDVVGTGLTTGTGASYPSFTYSVTTDSFGLTAAFSKGIMTVTAIDAGKTLLPGYIVSLGSYNAAVIKQLMGTAGGAGTYLVSYSLYDIASFATTAAGDLLQATPVGSTSTTGTWTFGLEYQGDLTIV